MLLYFLSFLFLLINPVLTNSNPQPAATVNAGEEEGIIWVENRRLTWDDFKSEADTDEELHAMTSTNIAVKAQCVNNLMRFDVKCVFVTKDSWTKNRASQRLLEHEQMHFDLTEIHARLLRQKLNQTVATCGNNRVKLDALVQHAFDEWKREQDQYDRETNHGLLDEKQNAWAELISSRLDKLEAFSYRTFALK